MEGCDLWLQFESESVLKAFMEASLPWESSNLPYLVPIDSSLESVESIFEEAPRWPSAAPYAGVWVPSDSQWVSLL